MQNIKKKKDFFINVYTLDLYTQCHININYHSSNIKLLLLNLFVVFADVVLATPKYVFLYISLGNIVSFDFAVQGLLISGLMYLAKCSSICQNQSVIGLLMVVLFV